MPAAIFIFLYACTLQADSIISVAEIIPPLYKRICNDQLRYLGWQKAKPFFA